MMESEKLAVLIDRLNGILDEFDALSTTDDIDELNAEFEDTIFLLENIDPEDEDAPEDLEGAIDELDDLIEGYAALGGAFAEPAERLRALTELTRTSLT